MTALIQHFGDTTDISRPCGRCTTSAPGARHRADHFRPPTTDEDKITAQDPPRTPPHQTHQHHGRLNTEVAPHLDRKDFNPLLTALASAGYIQIASDTFTNEKDEEITYKKAQLTYEGRTLATMHSPFS